jgi:galactokinase
VSKDERENLVKLFDSEFHKRPDVVASAPGRVNLIGEHTDYNGGEVLPIAIARRTWIVVAREEGSSISRAISTDDEARGEFSFRNPERSKSWWDYISTLGGFGDRDIALDIAVSSGVPAGAGLSSSAALQVAAATAFHALNGDSVSAREIALEAWRAENQFVGVSSGIMDQFASALSREGEALHIWCDTTETEHVPFVESVLVFDTAVPRSLRTSAFNERQSECAQALELLRRSKPNIPNLASVSPDDVISSDLPEVLKRRALHVSEETRRVRTAVKQLKANGTLDGDLLYQSHASLRDNYQCSTAELDWFVETAKTIDGISGARLTGAGWGGCAIALGARKALEAAGGVVASGYEKKFGRKPRYWVTEASSGARVESM